MSFLKGWVHLCHRNSRFGEISYQYQFHDYDFLDLYVQEIVNVDLPITKRFNIFCYDMLWYAEFSKQLLIRDQGKCCYILHLSSFQCEDTKFYLLLISEKDALYIDVFRTLQSINNGAYFLQNSWCQKEKV